MCYLIKVLLNTNVGGVCVPYHSECVHDSFSVLAFLSHYHSHGQLQTLLEGVALPCLAKAIVIKLTVSQTSGSFSSMWAGGAFYYYWHALLMNIINCISAQISLLKEN